jgi:hypothetical protein
MPFDIDPEDIALMYLTKEVAGLLETRPNVTLEKRIGSMIADADMTADQIAEAIADEDQIAQAEVAAEDGSKSAAAFLRNLEK